MSQPQHQPASERRTATRWVVDCEAVMRLVGGMVPGKLSDLSERGARFESIAPPAVGMSGMLCWGQQEHFCQVVWAGEGSCGVLFERAIGIEVVEAAAYPVEVELGPVANFGNIPLATKRAKRLVSIVR